MFSTTINQKTPTETVAFIEGKNMEFLITFNHFVANVGLVATFLIATKEAKK